MKKAGILGIFLGVCLFLRIKGLSLCMFRNIAGIKCPGCGSTRAVIEIIYGNFRQAFYYKTGLILFMPLYVAIGFDLTGNLKKHGKADLCVGMNRIATAVVLFLLLFMLIRNTSLYPLYY